MIVKRYGFIFSVFLGLNLYGAYVSPVPLDSNNKNKLITFTQVKNNIDLVLTDCASDVWSTVLYADNALIANQFINNGIRPVRVAIHNNTYDAISISPKSIDLPIVDNKIVSTQLRGNPALATILLGILASMYLIPGWIAESVIRHNRVYTPFSFRNLVRCPIASSLSALTLLGLGYYFYKANMSDNKIEDVCADLALENKIIVRSGESVSKILFINMNSWREIFDFRVYDEDGFGVIQTFKVKLT